MLYLVHNLARYLTYSVIVNPSERIFPHTLHSFHNERQHEVRFLQDFSLEIREPGRAETVIDDPRYSLSNIDDCARFQSWLRHKQSVETFEVETVTACKKQELAYKIGLKIWQDASDGPSISLFANNWTDKRNADMHLEFPIGLFKSGGTLGKGDTSRKIRLEFEKPSIESVSSRRKVGGRKSKGLNSFNMFSSMLILHRYDSRPRYD
jgi:hypothetical protein